MGYEIYQQDTDIFIDVSNINHALDALGEFASSHIIGFADSERICSCCALYDARNAFREARFDPVFNSHGDIVSFEFNGQKLANEEQVLNSIARFVKPGSFLQFEGEDSDLWRWVFDGTRVKTIAPKMLWDEKPEVDEKISEKIKRINETLTAIMSNEEKKIIFDNLLINKINKTTEDRDDIVEGICSIWNSVKDKDGVDMLFHYLAGITLEDFLRTCEKI